MSTATRQPLQPSSTRQTMNATTPDLSLASNLFGSLKPDIRRRIERYCAKPTPRGWDDIKGLIIHTEGCKWLGIWQAVLEIDPTFPSVGPAKDIKGRRVGPDWPRIPTPELIAQAIAYATH